MTDDELDRMVRAANPMSLEAARQIGADPEMAEEIKTRIPVEREAFEVVLDDAPGSRERRRSWWRPALAAAATVVVVGGVAVWMSRPAEPDSRPVAPEETTLVSPPPLRETLTSAVAGDEIQETDPSTEDVPPGIALPEWIDLGSSMIRTDFSDDEAWAQVCAEARRTISEEELGMALGMPYYAAVECVDDRRYEGLTAEGAVQLAATSPDLTFVFLADAETMSDSEHPVLAVNLWEEPHLSFRFVVSQMWTVEANLNEGAFFEDYVDSVDDDGIYRGF